MLQIGAWWITRTPGNIKLFHLNSQITAVTDNPHQKRIHNRFFPIEVKLNIAVFINIPFNFPASEDPILARIAFKQKMNRQLNKLLVRNWQNVI